MKTQEITKSCETCLYMATHEKCDNCLTLPGDYDNYNAANGWKSPEYRYLNYQEGNWMKRVMQFELEGKRNIVIGGQGEAEVNTKWTPEQTSKHLHYVAGECGYFCQNLRYVDADKKKGLKISTHEGIWALCWDDKGLKYIAYCDHDWNVTKERFWDREKSIELINAMQD